MPSEGPDKLGSEVPPLSQLSREASCVAGNPIGDGVSAPGHDSPREPPTSEQDTPQGLLNGQSSRSLSKPADARTKGHDAAVVAEDTCRAGAGRGVEKEAHSAGEAPGFGA